MANIQTNIKFIMKNTTLTGPRQTRIPKIIILIVFCMSFINLNAQTLITSATYAYSRSGFAPTTLIGPVTLIGANSDNVASAVTDIGFTFWFAGTSYTQFSVSENGLLTLGPTQISGTDVNNDMASATTLPKIAAYWDDLATGTGGYVRYALHGTAPNRILIVEWYVTVPKNAGGAANTLIQCHLYETSGTILFNTGTPGPGIICLYYFGETLHNSYFSFNMAYRVVRSGFR